MYILIIILLICIFYTMFILRALKLELNTYLLYKKYKFLNLLFYNFTFITLNFIRPVLEKYSRVLVFNTLLYSNTSEILILYSTRVFIFTSILYSTRVVKFHYFTQHCILAHIFTLPF